MTPRMRCGLLGMFWAVILVFPLAPFIALFFRFPIPFAGYQSGPQGFAHSVFAVMLYGLIGGFPLLLWVGAICGLLCNRIAGADLQRAQRLLFRLVLACDFVLLMILAVLDKIIGPW